MKRTFTASFKLKMDSNLPAHIRWIEWMSSNDFPQEIVKRWSQATHLQRLIDIGKQVIEEDIYSYVNYQGEGLISDSVSAKFAGPEGSSIGGTTVFLDPAISTAKGPMESMDPSQTSYAAFFERTEFNSFIHGKGNDVYNPAKHRPFFDDWTRRFSKHEQKAHLRSLMAAVKYRLPKDRAKD